MLNLIRADFYKTIHGKVLKVCFLMMTGWIFLCAYAQKATIGMREYLVGTKVSANYWDSFFNYYPVVFPLIIFCSYYFSNDFRQGTVKHYIEKGPDRVSPMYIPMSICNMAAGNVAIELGTKGESISVVTACAGGTHSIGEAYRMIKNGYEDAILAGGTEASITPTGIAGFTNIKALTQATDANRASIPFDKERSGFVMGEGAGVIVLEELEHAKARNAKIYAEIVGYGATSDAYHITSPAPDGEGAARAMKRALEENNTKPEDITYINAHGTSTHLNDAGETSAIKLAFGEASRKVMVSSTKGNTGHLLGAAGGVEAVVCIKAIEDNFVPPTINYKVPDEECDLDIVPNEGRNIEVKYAMSNSLGFGGHNSSIIFKKI